MNLIKNNLKTIIFTIIVFLILSVFLGIFLFINYKKTENLKYKIIEKFNEFQINKNNIFSLFIGNNINISNLSKYAEFDYAYNKFEVYNNDKDIKDILSIRFIKTDSIIIIIPILQEFLNFKEQSYAYKKICDLLMQINNTNKCLNSLVINISYSDIIDNDETIYNKQEYIKTISKIIGLNIPVYFDFNVLHELDKNKILIDNIDRMKSMQIIGYSNNQLSHNKFNLATLYESIELLITQLQNYIYSIIYTVDNAQTTMDLIVFINELKKIMYLCCEYSCKITRFIMQEDSPMFRGFIFTGCFKINQSESYLFISDFINYKLLGECNLICLSKKYIKRDRNKLYEFALILLFVFSTSYLMYNSKNYIESNNEIMTFKNSITQSVNKENFEEINNIVEKLYYINQIQSRKTIFNIFNLLEQIFIKYSKLKNQTNKKTFNNIYKLIYNEINFMIGEFVNMCQSEINAITNGNIQFYLSCVTKKYNSLKKIINTHNEMISNNNMCSNIPILLSLIDENKKQLNQDNINKIISIQENINDYHLDNFKTINISDDISFYSVQKIIDEIIKYINDKEYIRKISEIYNKVLTIINSNNVTNQISEIDSLIMLYEELKSSNLEDIIKYDICNKTLDKFKEINYILPDSYNKIKKYIYNVSQERISTIKSIKNETIGPVIDIYNFKFSDYFEHLMEAVKIIHNSKIYKRNTLNKGVVIEKNNTLIPIPKNIEKVIKIIEEFNILKNDLQKNKSSVVLEIGNKLLHANLKYLMNTEFEYFDINNVSNSFILMKILESYNHNEAFPRIIDYITFHNNEEGLTLLRNLLSNYINIIYNEIISLNTFHEKYNSVYFLEKNFIIASFKVKDKENLTSKIKDNIYKLNKIIKLIEPLIFSVTSKKNQIVYTHDLEKLDFIQNTIEILKDYKLEDNNNNSNKLSILISEINNLFLYDKVSDIKINQALYNESNYISYSYVQIIERFKNYKIEKEKNNLKELLKDLKLHIDNNYYPFNNLDTTNKVISYNEIISLNGTINNIIENYNNISNDINVDIKQLILCLEKYTQVVDELLDKLEFTFSIELDELLSKLNYVNLIIEDESSKEKINIKNNNINVTLSGKDKIKIIIPSIPIPGFKYKSYYSKYIKVSDEFILEINNNFIFNIMYLSGNIDKIDDNSVLIDITIPTIYETVNEFKGNIESEEINLFAKLLITNSNKIFGRVDHLTNIIDKILTLLQKNII